MNRVFGVLPRRIVYWLSYFQYVWLKMRLRALRNDRSSGIIYFIPEVPGHFMHAAPLYKLIGGTVVTASKKNKKEIMEKYQVECVAVDDVAISDVRNFKSDVLAKTFEYINKHAKVAIFYDLMDIGGRLSVPSIFLHHGVSLGKVRAFWEGESRIRYVKQLDYIANGDQFSHEIMLKRGVPEAKLLDLTIARTTEIIQKTVLFRWRNARKARRKLGVGRSRKIIVYMPSYWSKNSLEDTGLNLLRQIDEKYTLIFWPHPQTDRKIVQKYEEIAKRRSNIIIGQRVKGLDILDLYAVADLFVADPPTSVVSDMILANKPVVFAYGGGENATIADLPWPLEMVVSSALRLDCAASYHREVVNNIVGRALRVGLDKRAYRSFIDAVFYNTTGSAAVRTAQYIEVIVRDGKLKN